MEKETNFASLLSKPLVDDNEEVKYINSIDFIQTQQVKDLHPIYTQILLGLIENRLPHILKDSSPNYIYFLKNFEAIRLLTRHPTNRSKLFNIKYLHLFEQLLHKFMSISKGSNAISSNIIEICTIIKRYFNDDISVVDDQTHEQFTDFISNSSIVDNIISAFSCENKLLLIVLFNVMESIITRDIVISKLCNVNTMNVILNQLGSKNFDIASSFVEFVFKMMNKCPNKKFCSVFISLGGFVQLLEMYKRINDTANSKEAKTLIVTIIKIIITRNDIHINQLLNENTIKHIHELIITTISKPSSSLYRILSTLFSKLIMNDLLFFLCSQLPKPLFDLLITLCIHIKSHSHSKEETSTIEYIQIRIIRVLRTIVILEKYRRFFKSVFPSDLYSLFLQVGETHDQEFYCSFKQSLNCLSVADLKDMQHKSEIYKQSMAVHNYYDDVKGHACNFIGGYQVIEMIGKGGFGSVYKVYKNGKYFALKKISLEEKELQLILKNKNNIESGIPEVQIWKKMKHSKIIKYEEAFLDENNVYILMELVNGITLGEYISAFKENNMKINEDNIITIISQIMSGLKYMHKTANVIYRDLNPNNIMLDSKLNVKLIDFGLTIPTKTKTKVNVVRNSNSLAHSMTTVFEGSVFYSSPEIMNGDKVGPPCDIWALGCVIYEMFKYRPPFEGNNPLTVAKNICDKKFVEEIKESDIVNKDIYNIMQSCFEQDETKRANIDTISKMLGQSLLDRNNVLEEEKEALQHEIEILRELFHNNI